MKLVITLAITLLLFTKSQADLIWTVGLPGDGWPQDLGNGGGEETVFVQETGVNDLPGNPASPVVGQQSDDDYYFAGVYTTVVDGGKADPAATASKLPAGVPPAPRLDPAPDPVVHPDRGQQDATPAPSPAPHARTTPPPVRVSPIAAPAAPSDLSHPEDVSPASSPATAEKAAEGA